MRKEEGRGGEGRGGAHTDEKKWFRELFAGCGGRVDGFVAEEAEVRGRGGGGGRGGGVVALRCVVLDREVRVQVSAVVSIGRGRRGGGGVGVRVVGIQEYVAVGVLGVLAGVGDREGVGGGEGRSDW